MLLDIDRKLVTKVIVARLQKVAQGVLGEEQWGFVGSRLIRDGTAWVHGIIEGARACGLDGRLVFLDQEKAYDRVQRVWLGMVLDQIGVPSRFRASMLSLLGSSRVALMCNRN